MVSLSGFVLWVSRVTRRRHIWRILFSDRAWAFRLRRSLEHLMPRKVRKPPKYMRNAAQNIFVTDTLVPIDTDAEGAQPATRRSRALTLPRKNLTPEEYLREVMQDEGKRDELRMAAAGALLRYAKEPDDGPKLNEEQLDERITYLFEQLRRLGVKGGVSQEAGRTIDVEAIKEDSGHLPGLRPTTARAISEALR